MPHGFIDTRVWFLRSARFGGKISIQGQIMTLARGSDTSWSIPKDAIATDGVQEVSSLFVVPDEDRLGASARPDHGPGALAQGLVPRNHVTLVQLPGGGGDRSDGRLSR